MYIAFLTQLSFLLHRVTLKWVQFSMYMYKGSIGAICTDSLHGMYIYKIKT